MEFRLLGEVQLLAAGQLLDVGAPRQQAVLAALVVDAGRPVAIETLVDRVWGDSAPVEARNVLYSHLSRIRRLLKHAAECTGGAAGRIERRHAGYVLDIDPELVDLHRFRRQVEQGRSSQCADTVRADALTEALGLWRGPPLSAIPGEWATQLRDSWHRQRLDAVAQWAQTELRLGQHAAVVSVLADLVVEYPLVEPLEGLLMQALHAAGRDAEAIDRYTAVRQRLANDLGTDPGSELRALHQAILRGEQLPPAQPVQTFAPVGLLAAPAQLPPDVFGFTGRDHELDRLDALLSTGTTAGTVVISAVHGTAGIGKTALAVHWAHRVAHRFSDGQLYVNLRGFDPTGSPVTPAEAVRGFLDAFEVPAARIPAGLGAQIGLYRSLLANRRVLVVLDNARDAEQVRPLLPGASGSLVLMTSRNQLAGLVAATGAHPLTLGLPTAAEAREMLVRRLSVDRVSDEPHAVAEIIALCARLPLAMAIVAARAAIHPGFGLAVLADELRQARGGLDEFTGADPATNARAVFSWSYQELSPAAARLFRLLGLHGGPDVAAPAAASLAGVPTAEVRPLLAELADAHLVAEHAPGRYTFHDLLRAYAAEQAHTIDPDDQRHAAIHRALDHYLHTAHIAARLLVPNRDPITLTPHQPGVIPERLADHGHAMAWFSAEHAVLLAATDHAARAGLDTHTWQLAWTLTDFLDRRGHWHDAVHTLSAALQATRRLADRRWQACVHRLIARPHTQLGRLDDAYTHLWHALDLYRGDGDQTGQAHTHTHLTYALERQGRHAEALDHALRALDLFREAGHRDGHARSLNNIGWYHAELGDYEQALILCQQALTLHQQLGSRPGQAMTWDSLGYAHQHLGHHAEAIACYRHALDLFQELGDRREEAITRTRLGDTHHAAGDVASAGTAWRQSLAVLNQLSHPDADGVRVKLINLNDRDGCYASKGKRQCQNSSPITGSTQPPISSGSTSSGPAACARSCSTSREIQAILATPQSG